MATQQTELELSLPAAAVQLGLNYRRTFDALLTGQLSGRQLSNGRWRVTTTSVAALKRELRTREQGVPVAASA